MSYKFGGLEELGEKMCIIGELGKLLLEEIPLEETPPGYDRAPYNAYEKTENTTKEAIKCVSCHNVDRQLTTQLATVQFHAASAAPKPPGLPAMVDSGSLRTPSIPRQDSIPHPGGLHTVQDHEEYGEYPKSVGTRDSLPPQLPALGNRYGSLSSDGADQHNVRTTFGEFGTMRQSSSSETPAGTMVWKADSDQGHDLESHDYEYIQQREMDAAKEREAGHHRVPSGTASSDQAVTPTAPVSTIDEADNESEGHETELAHQQQPADSNRVSAGWQPLKVERGETTAQGNRGHALYDGPGYTLPAIGDSEPFGHEFLQSGEENLDNRQEQENASFQSAEDSDLAPPVMPGTRLPGPTDDGEFSTPLSSPPLANVSAQPQVYDGIAPADDEDESPSRSYAPAATTTSPPQQREYDYSDEPAAVVNIPAEKPERPLARYIPSVPPPAPSELDVYDHPASVRESYASHYPRDPRDSFAPSFATRDSLRDSSLPPGAFGVRDSYARTSNGSIGQGEVHEASVVNIPSTTTGFTINPPTSASGVMSAAAFRRGAKPRGAQSVDSLGSDPTSPGLPMSPTDPTPPRGPRRLPVPPTQAAGVPTTPSPRSSDEMRHVSGGAPPPPPYESNGSELR